MTKCDGWGHKNQTSVTDTGTRISRVVTGTRISRVVSPVSPCQAGDFVRSYPVWSL